MKLSHWLLCCCMFAPFPNAGGEQPATHASLDAREDGAAAARERDKARAAVDAAAKDRQQAAASVRELKDQIRSETGLTNVEGNDLRRIASNLQEQRENLQLEEAAAQGRRTGIEKAIDTFTERQEKRANSDEASSELKAAVDSRQAQLDRLREAVRSKTANVAELEAAEAALLYARAELAAARQRAAGPATDAIDAWNRELMNLEVAGQERRAKLRYIEERLKVLQPALGDVDRLEQGERELQQNEADLLNAERRLRGIQS